MNRACAAVPIAVRGHARCRLVHAQVVDRRQHNVVQLGGQVLAVERPAPLDALHFLPAHAQDPSACKK